MLNTRYGKRDQQDKIEYAPRTFKENGSVVVPRIDDDDAYCSRGWLKVIDVIPSYDATTQKVQLIGWEEDLIEKTITAQYEIVAIPVPTPKAKRYSKLRITMFCVNERIWSTVKHELEDTGYYDLYVMAQYFLDTDEYFQKGLAMFKNYFLVHGYDEEDYDNMVNSMLEFAFDGYETIKPSALQNNSQLSS